MRELRRPRVPDGLAQGARRTLDGIDDNLYGHLELTAQEERTLRAFQQLLRAKASQIREGV